MVSPSSPAGTAEKKPVFAKAATRQAPFSGVPAGLVAIPSNPGVQTPGYFSRRDGIPSGHTVFGCPKIEMRPFVQIENNYCHRVFV
jgi:hypothetical protein